MTHATCNPLQRDDNTCLYGTYDLEEQREILAQFEESRRIRSTKQPDDDSRAAAPSQSRSSSATAISTAALDEGHRISDDSLELSSFLNDDTAREQQAILDEIRRSQRSSSRFSFESPSSVTFEQDDSQREEGTNDEEEGEHEPPLWSRGGSFFPATAKEGDRRNCRLHTSAPTLEGRGGDKRVSRRRLQVLHNMSLQESASGRRGLLDCSADDIKEKDETVSPARQRGRAAVAMTATKKITTVDQRSSDERGISAAKGTRKTVRCAECRRRYYVSLQCKIMYCPRCETLTPTSLEE